jgi:hypothetical protein
MSESPYLYGKPQTNGFAQPRGTVDQTLIDKTTHQFNQASAATLRPKIDGLLSIFKGYPEFSLASVAYTLRVK